MLSVALAALLCAAPSPRPPPDAGEPAPPPFVVFVPGVEALVPVGDGRMVMDGLPMRIQAAKSNWNWLELQKYFQAEFRKAGFFLPPPKEVKPLKVPIVSAYDPKRELFYTVIITPETDGKTTLILGESFVAERVPPALSQAQKLVPIHPAARNLMQADVEVARGASYFAAAPAEEVVAFYRDALGQAGYEESEVLTFRKDSDQIRVLVQPSDAGCSVSAVRRTVPQ